MMLIFVSPRWIEVFLARIVMPFSRSRSPESMTRSFTSWFSRNEPACQSIASTSVVLPWSTWATMATLRKSSLSTVAQRSDRVPGPYGGGAMKVVHCPCGVNIEGGTDDELVQNVEAHVASDHPEQVGKMTREEIIGMAHDH